MQTFIPLAPFSLFLPSVTLVTVHLEAPAHHSDLGVISIVPISSSGDDNPDTATCECGLMTFTALDVDLYSLTPYKMEMKQFYYLKLR